MFPTVTVRISALCCFLVGVALLLAYHTSIMAHERRAWTLFLGVFILFASGAIRLVSLERELATLRREIAKLQRRDA